MSNYYPVHLDIADRKCVVVGGGQIAERKALSLLECGARVTIVSPQLTPGLQRLVEQEQVAAIRREYRETDLAGSFLVIAATDDVQVNRAVALDAERNNLLVNVVDDPAHCNFIVPSVVRRGDLVVAVSTGGQSPALARKLRSQLERILAPEYGPLLTLITEVRDELKRDGRRSDPEAWQEALDEDLIELIRRGMVDQARERIVTALNNRSEASGSS